jgi:hypothetical protein
MEDVGLWEAAANLWEDGAEASQEAGTSTSRPSGAAWQPAPSAQPNLFSSIEDALRRAFSGPRKYLMGIAFFGVIILFSAFPVTFCSLYKRSWCLSAGYRWGAFLLLTAAMSSFWACLQYFGIRVPAPPVIQAYATVRPRLHSAVGFGASMYSAHCAALLRHLASIARHAQVASRGHIRNATSGTVTLC